MTAAYPLKIFYDGACGVCSREIRHYRRVADDRIHFINIADPCFRADPFGKTEEEFQKELHALDADGRFFTGVEAFRRLWEALPSPFYPLLSATVGLPGINLISRISYAVFARYRHLLRSEKLNSCPLPKLHDSGSDDKNAHKS